MPLTAEASNLSKSDENQVFKTFWYVCETVFALSNDNGELNTNSAIASASMPVGARLGVKDGATDGTAVGATDGVPDGAVIGPYVDGALLGPYVSPTTVGI